MWHVSSTNDVIFSFTLKKAKKNGAGEGNRTTDTGIFSPLLYRLSYLGILYMAGELGFEPRHLAISPVFKTGPLAVRTSTHNSIKILML